jgi:hypothetical protein
MTVERTVSIMYVVPEELRDVTHEDVEAAIGEAVRDFCLPFLHGPHEAGGTAGPGDPGEPAEAGRARPLRQIEDCLDTIEEDALKRRITEILFENRELKGRIQ